MWPWWLKKASTWLQWTFSFWIRGIASFCRSFIWTVYRDGVFFIWFQWFQRCSGLSDIFCRSFGSKCGKTLGGRQWVRFVDNCCLCWLRSETRNKPPSWFWKSTVWYANSVEKYSQTVNLCHPPDTTTRWSSYDVTFRWRHLKMVINAQMIKCMGFPLFAMFPGFSP